MNLLKTFFITWYGWAKKYDFSYSEKGCVSLAAYILALLFWGNIVTLYWLLSLFFDLSFFPAKNVGIVLMLLCIFLIALLLHVLFVKNNQFRVLNNHPSKSQKSFGIKGSTITLLYSALSLVIFILVAYFHITQYQKIHGIN